MGAKTAAQLIDEALNLAGDTRLSTPALKWLNTWLRSTYTAWPWPFLQRRTTGVALATGAETVSFGNGASVTPHVKRIFDPIWVYNSTKTKKYRARIRTLIGGSLDEDETVNDNSVGRGIPQQFKVRADSSVFGKWNLIPNPIPDVDYLLAIEYQVIPADLAASSETPFYPNDRTMVQAIFTEAKRYMKDTAEYRDALQVLASQVADDRLKLGDTEGTNDTIPLDKSVFRY